MPNFQWINVTDKADFAGRDGAGAVTHAGAMWLLGGWNPSDKKMFPRICINDVWRSVDGRSWQLIKPNTFIDATFDPASDWEGRHTAGYVAFRDKMWVLGGDCNQKHYQPDVWNSVDGRKWTRICHGDGLPWGMRVLHHTVVFKDRIWVMGGQTMPIFTQDREAFYNDIWNSEDGIHWNRVEPRGEHWCPRGMIGNNAVHNGRMWIIGGGTYDTPQTRTRNFYNDVWSSDDGVHWHRHLEHAPWHPRQYHEIAAFDGRLWVMEGWDGKANRKDVWHSEDGVTWHELPGTPWAPRHAASVFVHDNALWMVAGNNMEPDVWKLVRK